MLIFGNVAVVIDTDGSAFITKAEFDSLKNNFQSQIDSYNSSIDSKIDGAIAAYLSGLNVASEFNEDKILSNFSTYTFKDKLYVELSYTEISQGTATVYDFSEGWGTSSIPHPIINWRPLLETTGNIYWGFSWEKYNAVGLMNISWSYPAQAGTRIEDYGASFIGLKLTDDSILLPTMFCPLVCYYSAIQNTDVTGSSRLQNKYGATNGITILNGGLFKQQGYNQTGIIFGTADGNVSNPDASNTKFISTLNFPAWNTMAKFRTGQLMLNTSSTDYGKLYKNTNRYLSTNIYSEWNTLLLSAPTDKIVFTALYDDDTSPMSNMYNLNPTVNNNTLDGTLSLPITSATWQNWYTPNATEYPKPNIVVATGASVVFPSAYKIMNFYEINNRNSYAAGNVIKFGDGLPLARASAKGIMNIKMKTTRSSGNGSSNRLTLKKGAFNNEVGNGNTLKVCDAGGTEGDYAVNLVPNSNGEFDIYINVNPGDVIYCRVSPQDTTGKISASISEYSCTTVSSL